MNHEIFDDLECIFAMQKSNVDVVLYNQTGFCQIKLHFFCQGKEKKIEQDKKRDV